MSKKLFQYTLLKQDGTKQIFNPSPKKDFGELYKLLDCTRVQLVPAQYYPDEYIEAHLWADDEGRFNTDNTRNPHMKVLKGDPSLGEPDEFDVVGNVIVEAHYEPIN